MYIPHLNKDKKLKSILRGQEPIQLRKKNNIFLHLIASIMSQQLSTKVAEVIYGRFLNLYQGKIPEPIQVLKTPSDKLRGIGLSNAKVSYVKNVAQFAIDYGLESKKLNKMSNQELLDYLIQIKGVGKWTVEMQMMFTLGREDVFPVDDLGIQQAMIRLYDLSTANKKELRTSMLSISEQWSPYRTYASLHLWRWKDQSKKQ